MSEGGIPKNGVTLNRVVARKETGQAVFWFDGVRAWTDADSPLDPERCYNILFQCSSCGGRRRVAQVEGNRHRSLLRHPCHWFSCPHTIRILKGPVCGYVCGDSSCGGRDGNVLDTVTTLDKDERKYQRGWSSMDPGPPDLWREAPDSD